MKRDGRSLTLASALLATALTGVVVGAGSTPALAAEFEPLDAPQRIADTRPSGDTVDDVAQGGGPISGGTVLELQVGGRAGIPADAPAAVLNVTTTNAVGRGFITIYPCDAPQPNAANLNYEAGQIIANAVFAALDDDGKTCIFTSTTANVIVDATGTLPGDSFDALPAPQRIVDTRPTGDTVDDVNEGTGKVGPNDEIEVQVAGRAGIDPDATTAVLNVTVTNPELRGFLTLYPCDQTLPTAANLNYETDQIIANSVVAKLDGEGKTCVYTNSRTNIVLDVTGTLPADTFAPLDAPQRIADTREAGDTADGQVEKTGYRRAGTTLQLPVAGRVGIPAGASAAVLNVTVAQGQGRGFVTVHPRNSDRPNAANLNYEQAQIIANTVVAKIGGDGKICMFASESTEFIVDVTGYLMGPAPADDGTDCPMEFGPGLHPVGEYQMPPGRYVSDPAPDDLFGFCDAHRRSGETFDTFLAGNTVASGGRILIDVQPSDAFFNYRFDRCPPLRPYEFPNPAPDPGSLPTIAPDGFNVVGHHVAPGTYTTEVGFGQICTAYRLRDFSGFLGSFQVSPQTIEKVERNSPGPLQITVQPGDVGAAFFTCEWTRS